MKITIVNFSGIRGGNCFASADFALQRFKAEGNEVERFDFADLDISPCSKCSKECYRQRTLCPHYHDDEITIIKSILKSDKVVFIVPNYGDYPSSGFFIYNERCCCTLQGDKELLEKYLEVPKKFVIISNTERENFRRAFTYHSKSLKQSDTLFLSTERYGKSVTRGDLIAVPEVSSLLGEFLDF